MADFTTSTRNQIIDWLVGVSNPSPVASARYLALFDGDPQGAGAEVTATIRTAGRVEITSIMAASAFGSTSNSSIIDFGDSASGSTGTQFDYVAIYDAATAGNLLASDALSGGQQTVTQGNPVSIPSAGLTISVS